MAGLDEADLSLDEMRVRRSNAAGELIHLAKCKKATYSALTMPHHRNGEPANGR
jgi:hypothetical protein